MSTALKCDRCHNYFDYDPSAKFNFIAFGHKDIIIGKNFPVKDICPDCMEQFMTWFENPDVNETDCTDRSNGATEKELELASKLNDAKIYIAQLKAELGYTISKEEIDSVSSEPEYKDPCESCHGDVFMGKTLDELREFCNNFSKDCSECPFYDEDLWDECSLKEEPHNWASEEEILSKLLDYKIKHPDWRKEK